ncbi:MAG: chromo domain-containing protein, partial [Nostocales cyanobacterium ELA608]
MDKGKKKKSVGKRTPKPYKSKIKEEWKGKTITKDPRPRMKIRTEDVEVYLSRDDIDHGCDTEYDEKIVEVLKAMGNDINSYEVGEIGGEEGGLYICQSGVSRGHIEKSLDEADLIFVAFFEKKLVGYACIDVRKKKKEYLLTIICTAIEASGLGQTLLNDYIWPHAVAHNMVGIELHSVPNKLTYYGKTNYTLGADCATSLTTKELTSNSWDIEKYPKHFEEVIDPITHDPKYDLKKFKDSYGMIHDVNKSYNDYFKTITEYLAIEEDEDEKDKKKKVAKTKLIKKCKSREFQETNDNTFRESCLTDGFKMYRCNTGLYKPKPDPNGGAAAAPTEGLQAEKEAEYEVEAILGKKRKGRGWIYLIKWAGYD